MLNKKDLQSIFLINGLKVLGAGSGFLLAFVLAGLKSYETVGDFYSTVSLAVLLSSLFFLGGHQGVFKFFGYDIRLKNLVTSIESSFLIVILSLAATSVFFISSVMGKIIFLACMLSLVELSYASAVMNSQQILASFVFHSGRNVLFLLIVLVLEFVFVFEYSVLIIYVWLNVGFAILGLTWIVYNARKKNVVGEIEARSVVSSILRLGLTNSILTALRQGDVFFVSVFVDDQKVGYYKLASSLGILIHFLNASILARFIARLRDETTFSKINEIISSITRFASLACFSLLLITLVGFSILINHEIVDPEVLAIFLIVAPLQVSFSFFAIYAPVLNVRAYDIRVTQNSLIAALFMAGMYTVVSVSNFPPYLVNSTAMLIFGILNFRVFRRAFKN